MSALTGDITSEGPELTLRKPREVIVQAGAYGEHEFAAIRIEGTERRADGAPVRAALPAGTRMILSADLERSVSDPIELRAPLVDSHPRSRRGNDTAR